MIGTSVMKELIRFYEYLRSDSLTSFLPMFPFDHSLKTGGRNSGTGGEFCKIYKNIFFAEHLLGTVSTLTTELKKGHRNQFYGRVFVKYKFSIFLLYFYENFCLFYMKLLTFPQCQFLKYSQK